MTRNKIYIAVVLGSLFAVGIVIPKLTVHDLVQVDDSLQSCATTGVKSSLNNSFERIALTLGKSRITEVHVNEVGVEIFTLFRIPLGILRGQPDLKIGVTCDFAVPVPVSSAQVPDGWYSHDLISTITAPELLKYVVLTKHKDLPQRNAGDAPYDTPQITVTETKIDVPPEQEVQQEGLGTSDGIDAGLPAGHWSTYKGHKMFTITLELGGDAVMLFGGDKKYSFTFVGESIDRTDLWKVISYYAEDPAFPMLSREETRANCNVDNLPPGQEYDIQADPETGYVTLGYMLATPHGNPQETYLFLNYNDDISQCSPGMKDLLERTKGHGDAMTR